MVGEKMGQGLRVFNEHGVLTLDTDFRLTRSLGLQYVNNDSDGQIYVAEFSQGIPWVIPIANWDDIIKKELDWATVPYVARPSIEGNILKWMWVLPPKPRAPGVFYASWFMYGVY